MGRGNGNIPKHMKKKGITHIAPNEEYVRHIAKISGQDRQEQTEPDENLDQLMRMAYYDGVTGTYRFEIFREMVKKQMKVFPECTIAVLKICHFQRIRVIYERETLDRLLKKVADFLSACCKRGELVCWDGGDKFYLYLYECRRKALEIQMKEILDKISEISQVVLIGYPVVFHIGIVNSVLKGTAKISSLDQMFKYITAALTAAEMSPNSRICFFDTELYKKEKMENEMEMRKDQAIQTEEFQLYLQPKVDLSTGRLQSAEALVRWKWSGGKILTPDKFMKLFEKNGFCVQLDIYMLKQVCRLMNSWKEMGIEPIPVSVNLCKRSLYDRGFADTAKSILQEFCILPQMITLEILESMAVDNAEKTNQILCELKDTGFRISMDDFGSGYSSLNVLSKLNIDELKIDQWFLRGMGGNEKEKIVLNMIINLSRQLSISTVVEGVETKEHEEMVKSMGCDYGQGYLYSKPLPAGEFMEKYMK